MKKYAWLLMLSAGSLATYFTYHYSEKNRSTEEIRRYQHLKKEVVPTMLVHKEESIAPENLYENEKAKEAHERIQKKYQSLSEPSKPKKETIVSSKPKKETMISHRPKTISQNSPVKTSRRPSYEKIEDALKSSILHLVSHQNIDNSLDSHHKLEKSLTYKNLSDLKLLQNDTVYSGTRTSKQEFIIHNVQENYILGEKGTLIVFPPDAFLNSKGMIENENIKIELQEYYTKPELLLSGFYTQNSHQVYETDGIISIKAYKNDEELIVNPSKKIMICLKSNNEDSHYSLFHRGAEGEWQQIAEQDKNLIPLPLELLNLHNHFGNTYDRTLIATKAFARRYRYYSEHALAYKKAITGIYLNLIKEPLYKADENVLLYLRDIKAEKSVIEQFEKFYQEKLGQTVNFNNVHYSPEISLTEQFEQLGNTKAEAERLAQYFLIRKGFQEWFRYHPEDKNFANKIYKVSKLGTFASMKFHRSVEQYTPVAWNNLNGLNLEHCSIYFIDNQRNSILKVATDNEQQLFIPSNFHKGSLMLFNKVENESYLAIYQVQDSKDGKYLQSEVDYQKVNEIELENRLTHLFK